MEDKLKSSLDKLLEIFASESLPEMVAKTVIKADQENMLPSDKWSMGNQLLMYAYGTEDARGFKQWQQVNRRVKKGAKAFYILGPCTKKVKIKKQEKEEEKFILTGFKAIAVFRYEDTEGEEICYPDYLPKELPPLWDVAQKMGIEVSYRPFSGYEYGSITIDGKKMTLKTHDVKTFFHELGHAAHGKFKIQKGGQHAEQEIVAETVACVLCEMYGYSGYLYHGYKYIKSYAAAKNTKEMLRAMMSVLSDVKHCLEIILNIAENQTAIA